MFDYHMVVTRSADEVKLVADLLAAGVSQAEVARRTGVPRGTLRGWIGPGIDAVVARRVGAVHPGDPAGVCGFVDRVPEPPYAYLLGLYLGDGCLSPYRTGVYRLRISLDLRYPGIIDECEKAMSEVLPNKVGRVPAPGCASVNSYSQHWPCVFPQHAPGVKHHRPIVLEPWQVRIALDAYPKLLLRGLIHSDGWRGTNRVPRGYSYPRYMFSNRSKDIRDLFSEACWRVGVRTTQCGGWQVSVARRPDVEFMDTFIGRKR
jgi:hypothetical protein